MNDHNEYIRFIESEMNELVGSKVKSTSPVNGVVKILNHFMNKQGTVRKYIFMYPVRIQHPEIKFKTKVPGEPVDEGKVEITIRDIANDMASCVIFDVVNHNGFIMISDFKSKYGECSQREQYAIPKRESENNTIEPNMPAELVSKIYSNVYNEYPVS